MSLKTKVQLERERERVKGLSQVGDKRFCSKYHCASFYNDNLSNEFTVISARSIFAEQYL
jgi:hypothetical protein